MNTKNTRLISITTLLALALLTAPVGCSSRRSSSESSSTTEIREDDSTRARYYGEPRDVEVTRSETKTEESSGRSTGFFSILGDIIAWPFHAISAIF